MSEPECAALNSRKGMIRHERLLKIWFGCEGARTQDEAPAEREASRADPQLSSSATLVL